MYNTEPYSGTSECTIQSLTVVLLNVWYGSQKVPVSFFYKMVFICATETVGTRHGPFNGELNGPFNG